LFFFIFVFCLFQFWFWFWFWGVFFFKHLIEMFSFSGKTLQGHKIDGTLQHVSGHLSPFYFSLKVLETLILRYEDDKADNIVAELVGNQYRLRTIGTWLGRGFTCLLFVFFFNFFKKIKFFLVSLSVCSYLLYFFII
jgi:hypothetical protein